MSQNGPKTTSLTSLKKIRKFFFQVQSRRSADSFKPLNSSLVQSAEELGGW